MGLLVSSSPTSLAPTDGDRTSPVPARSGSVRRQHSIYLPSKGRLRRTSGIEGRVRPDGPDPVGRMQRESVGCTYLGECHRRRRRRARSRDVCERTADRRPRLGSRGHVAAGRDASTPSASTGRQNIEQSPSGSGAFTAVTPFWQHPQFYIYIWTRSLRVILSCCCSQPWGDEMTTGNNWPLRGLLRAALHVRAFV